MEEAEVTQAPVVGPVPPPSVEGPETVPQNPFLEGIPVQERVVSSQVARHLREARASFPPGVLEQKIERMVLRIHEVSKDVDRITLVNG